MPTNAANAAYEEAYIAMLQGEDEMCSTHCDTYYAMVDTLTTVESLVADIKVEIQDAWDEIPPPLVNYSTSAADAVMVFKNLWLSDHKKS